MGTHDSWLSYWTSHFIFQVLFLIDPIDKVAIQNLKSYKDKQFVDITKEDLDLGNWLFYVLYAYFRHRTYILVSVLSV